MRKSRKSDIRASRDSVQLTIRSLFECHVLRKNGFSRSPRPGFAIRDQRSTADSARGKHDAELHGLMANGRGHYRPQAAAHNRNTHPLADLIPKRRSPRASVPSRRSRTPNPPHRSSKPQRPSNNFRSAPLPSLAHPPQLFLYFRPAWLSKASITALRPAALRRSRARRCPGAGDRPLPAS